MKSNYLHLWKIASGTLSLVFLGIVILGLLPSVVDVYEKQNALSYQNEQIEVMGNWKEQLVDLENKQSVLDERLGEIVFDLADDREFSAIVKELFSEAGLASVSVQRIQPTGEKRNGEYNFKMVSLEVIGSYHSIAKFINRIEQNGLMIEVQSLNIENKEYGNNLLNGFISLEITMMRS